MFKKIIAWMLLITVTATVAIGGTLAYLTDRDSEANVFTVGDVSIDLDEDFEQGSELLPGVEIEKKPTVTNTGKNDAYVWATIAVPGKLDSVVDFVNQGTEPWNWTAVAKAENVTIEEGGVPYTVYTVLYNEKLAKDAETSALFEKVALDKTVDIDPEGKWYTVVAGDAEYLDWSNENGNPVIYVSAYAIQTEGFDTAMDAYTAYNKQWTTEGGVNNGDEWAEVPTVTFVAGHKLVTTGTDGSVAPDEENVTTLVRGIVSDNLTTIENLVIEEGYLVLGNRSVCKCPTIKSVSLPKTLTTIEESAFQQAGITSVEIPENVTSIGFGAMQGCLNLESIVINAKNVTMENYVARACPNLKEVYIYSESVSFGSGSMYFTNKEDGDASGITFYVANKDVADTLYAAFSTSHSYGLLIKSIDGATTYYNTLK